MRAVMFGSLLVLVALVSLPVQPAMGASAPAAATAPVPGPGPQELMQQISNNVLRDLDANREAYRKDPKKLRALIDKHLLPHFDVEYSARLVLGKHWRTATDDQKKRFVDAFYQSLMRNYGNAMVDFDRLTILPYKGDPNATTATVRTAIKRDNGAPVSVNYSVHATPKGWLAWDVVIEGVSYVKNYRTDFGAEIEQKGIDAVIQRLETQNASGKPDAAVTAGAKGALTVGSFSIERIAQDRLAVSGELGFTTATEALKAGQRMIGNQPCTIDLAKVTEGDSAGLAVLLEWIATAEARGARLRYENVPDQILAIARISDVQDLLTQS